MERFTSTSTTRDSTISPYQIDPEEAAVNPTVVNSDPVDSGTLQNLHNVVVSQDSPIAKAGTAGTKRDLRKSQILSLLEHTDKTELEKSASDNPVSEKDEAQIKLQAQIAHASQAFERAEEKRGAAGKNEKIKDLVGKYKYGDLHKLFPQIKQMEELERTEFLCDILRVAGRLLTDGQKLVHGENLCRDILTALPQPVPDEIWIEVAPELCLFGLHEKVPKRLLPFDTDPNKNPDPYANFIATSILNFCLERKMPCHWMVASCIDSQTLWKLLDAQKHSSPVECLNMTYSGREHGWMMDRLVNGLMNVKEGNTLQIVEWLVRGEFGKSGIPAQLAKFINDNKYKASFGALVRIFDQYEKTLDVQKIFDVGVLKGLPSSEELSLLLKCSLFVMKEYAPQRKKFLDKVWATALNCPVVEMPKWWACFRSNSKIVPGRVFNQFFQKFSFAYVANELLFGSLDSRTQKAIHHAITSSTQSVLL